MGNICLYIFHDQGIFNFLLLLFGLKNHFLFSGIITKWSPCFHFLFFLERFVSTGKMRTKAHFHYFLHKTFLPRRPFFLSSIWDGGIWCIGIRVWMFGCSVANAFDVHWSLWIFSVFSLGQRIMSSSSHKICMLFASFDNTVSFVVHKLLRSLTIIVRQMLSIGTSLQLFLVHYLLHIHFHW